MEQGTDKAVLVMGSIHRVLKAEKLLLSAGLEVDTLVTPREVSADCGMVVVVRAEDLERAVASLSEAGLRPAEVWKSAGGRLARLAAAPAE